MSKTKLGPIASQFVTTEKAKAKYCLGKFVASSLSGFLAGIIITCLIWFLVVDAFFF